MPLPSRASARPAVTAKMISGTGSVPTRLVMNDGSGLWVPPSFPPSTPSIRKARGHGSASGMMAATTVTKTEPVASFQYGRAYGRTRQR